MERDEDILDRLDGRRREHMAAVASDAKPKAREAMRSVPYAFDEDEAEAFVSGYIMGVHG